MSKRVKLLCGLIAVLLIVPVYISVSSAQQLVLADSSIASYSWGYEYILDSGDVVEVGDSATEDFRACVKTIHNDCWFQLELQGGGVYEPSVDDLVISLDWSSDIHVAFYPADNGGIEYDVILDKKQAQLDSITFDIDWQGITWQKIYGLDVEYDEARCEADFDGVAPYVITPTSITDDDGIVWKTLLEKEVNSYVGIATEANTNTDYYENGVSYTRLSKTYLHIYRGQMTDALSDTAWIENIEIDEQNKTITFWLPKDWLKSAEYPVQQLCGVDPAYTEEMASAQDITGSMSDGTWTACDMADFGLSNTQCVLEVMLENQQKGAENLIGVRATSSSLSRYVNIHECEPTGGGAGDTHCRMFVQTGASGDFEAYSEDVSDTYFYIIGYWENVSFTEAITEINPDLTATWSDNSSGDTIEPSVVHHMVICLTTQDAKVAGIRAYGGSIERKILLHEAEDGGASCIDYIVKADSNGYIDIYIDNSSFQDVYDMGYFGSELDFVELWELPTVSYGSWLTCDLSAYLDQDGRIVDYMLLNSATDASTLMGVRDGDDTSTNRYLYEHEAEDDGSSTGEKTGFSMSVTTNSSGVIYVYRGADTVWPYLTGYFKPTTSLDISLDINSYGFGILDTSETANTGLTYFTVTNNGDSTIDITIHGEDMTGTGVTWALSDTATAGDATYGLKAGLSGGSYNIVVKKTVTYNFLVEDLASSGTQEFGLEIYAPTANIGSVLMTGDVTLTASLAT